MEMESTAYPFVELTSLEQQQPLDSHHQTGDLVNPDENQKPQNAGAGRPAAAAAPLHDDGVEEAESDSSLDEEELINDMLTPGLIFTVRLAMTLLLLLVVPAFLLTWWTKQQFGFLLGCLWIILGSLFLSLVYLMQMKVTRRPGHRRGGVFFVLDAAFEMIGKEYTDFVDDWRQELLLLEYDPTYVGPGTDGLKSKQKRKLRSLVFKTVVKPFLPFLRRRRNKRQQKQQAAEDNANANNYVPPIEAVEII
jgi:hypothetical protein